MNHRFLTLAALSLAACSTQPTPFDPGDAGPQPDGAQLDGAADDVVTGDDALVQVDRVVIPLRDAQPSLDMTIVYAHSDDTLYAIDPRTNAFRTVGTFRFPTGDRNNHSMTDLAVDGMGSLVGVTQDALYRIDADTAACTLIHSLSGMLPNNSIFVGLTFLPAGELDPDNEVLVGGTLGTNGGTLWRIDPATGRSTMLGNLRAGSTAYNLSGDIVSVRGAGTFVTVRRTTASSTDSDSLATVNVRTGALTLVGSNTGFDRIFGVGYWRSTLYGFTRQGEFITIDASTGRGRMVSSPAMQFSGAGVTTLAPTAPP